MILYTPMQLELVVEGMDSMEQPRERETFVNGIPALVQDRQDGSCQLVKLLSTDPQDFLRKDLLPGSSV